MRSQLIKVPKQEDITKYIVDFLVDQISNPSNRHGVSYGYDLYLPNVMRKWCDEHHSHFESVNNSLNIETFLPEISPYFYEASWELCRRGILRPGVRRHREQETDDGSAGNGYSITSFGRQWLSEEDKDTFVPTEPERFSQMLAPYEKLFGPGFHERANQAIRCYGAHAYLACCVMCGASAESILLHLAIKKIGDENEAIKLYKAANGRKKLRDFIILGKIKRLQDEFDRCFFLLQYWRDEAAHGRKSDISENEAYTSLASLLRCSLFATNNYQELSS